MGTCCNSTEKVNEIQEYTNDDNYQSPKIEQTLKHLIIIGFIRQLGLNLPSDIIHLVSLWCADYIAIWSSMHKGDSIFLSEHHTKASLIHGKNQSIRCKYPIYRGSIVTLNYTFYIADDIIYEIVGVVSSEFDGEWSSLKTPYHSQDLQKYCYGLSCYDDCYQYYGAPKDLGWSAGQIPTAKEVTIQMVVDWKTCDDCCLSFYIDDVVKGPKKTSPSMTLPELSVEHVWYPMTCFSGNGNWCTIQCIDSIQT
eukprot:403054_1